MNIKYQFFNKDLNDNSLLYRKDLDDKDLNVYESLNLFLIENKNNFNDMEYNFLNDLIQSQDVSNYIIAFEIIKSK